MNKKRLTIGIIAIAVVALIITLVFVFNSNKKDNIDNPSSSSDSSEVNEPLDVVEDVKDKITSDNFNTQLNSLMGDKFDIKKYDSNYMYRMGHEKFRLSDMETYKGIAKEGENSFEASITRGIANNPDFSISFKVYDDSQSEIEDMAYSLIKSITGDEIANKIKEAEYNDINLVQTNTEEYQDITINKTVTSLSDIDDYYGESPTTSTYKQYTFGVHYSAYEEDLKAEYEIKEYDKLLFRTIPIFAKSKSTDLTYSLAASNFGFLQEAANIAVSAYNYEQLEDGDSCSLEITSYADTGEKIISTFDCRYDNTSELVDYSFKTSTEYLETPEDAMNKALKILNGVTELSFSNEMFVKLEETKENSLETTYILSTDSEELEGINVVITVCKEPALGYYASISAM